MNGAVNPGNKLCRRKQCATHEDMAAPITNNATDMILISINTPMAMPTKSEAAIVPTTVPATANMASCHELQMIPINMIIPESALF